MECKGDLEAVRSGLQSQIIKVTTGAGTINYHLIRLNVKKYRYQLLHPPVYTLAPVSNTKEIINEIQGI